MELEKVLENLEESISSELEKLVKKGDLNPAEIKSASDAVCLLKEIRELNEESGEESGEYSERGGRSSYRRGSYAMGRGRRYATRYDHYEHGESRHSINDRIVDKLERMMDDASSEYERGVLAGWISKVASE